MLAEVADRLWYPLWDANIRLDHSVRTVSEAVGIAGSDMTAALGHAGGTPHRRRGGAVQRADRRGAAAVAHRNPFADRRTRRDDAGALAALRPDLQPRRARSQVGPRRPARRPTVWTRWRSPSSSTATASATRTCLRVRWTVRTAPCSTCAPNCTGCRAAGAISCWPSSATRSAPPWGSVTDSPCRACCPTPGGPSATTPKPGFGPPSTPCRGAA